MADEFQRVLGRMPECRERRDAQDRAQPLDWRAGIIIE
jgi:hypothetical protein